VGKFRFVQKGEKISIINELNLDRYLMGLLNKEMSSHYPEEALKAQAIAARSYALATIAEKKKNFKEDYFLQSTELDQVYEGVGFESAKSKKIVKETLGDVLFYKNNILKAYYHSSSGGSLEKPQNVWDSRGIKSDVGAYEVKRVPTEESTDESRWNIVISPWLGFRWNGLGKILDLQITEKTESGRVKKIFIQGEKGKVSVSGADFRKKLGNRWLKSTLFEIKKNKTSWLVEGRGFGHGVGMSQMGARRMANDGYKAKEILAFYYPNAEVKNIKNNEDLLSLKKESSEINTSPQVLLR
jgi:stage II sporulation protein D